MVTMELRQMDERKLAVVAILWLAVEFVILGPFSAVYTGDSLNSLIPGLIAGRFSNEWNSLSSAGWDRVATNPLGDAAYWLFRHLAPWLAYQVDVIVQIVGAFGGVYGLTRLRLRLGAPASLFAAFLFALGVNGQVHLASFHLEPALVLATSLVLERRTSPLRWAMLLGVATLMSGLAWIAELVPFVAAVVISWFLFVERPRRVSDWAIVLLAATFPLILKVDDLALLKQYSPLSHRDLLVPSPQWADALQVPFFLNNHRLTLAAVVCTISLLPPRTMPKGVLAGLVLWLAALYAAKPLEVLLVDWLPQLRGYSFDRFAHAPTLLLIIGSAFGFQALIDGRIPWLSLKARGLAMIVIFFLTLLLSLEMKFVTTYAWLSQGNFRANFESPALLRLASRLRAQPQPERVEPVQMYPSYLHAYGIETGGGLHALFSRRYYEFWSTMLEPWLGARNLAPGNFGVAPPESYARTGDWPRFRSTLLMLNPDGHRKEWRLGDLFRLNMLSLANVGWLVSRDRLTDPGLELVEDGGGAWGGLSTIEKVKRNVVANFRGREALFVYRNTSVLPRFFAAEQLVVRPDGRAVLNMVATLTPEELRRTVVAESAALPPRVKADSRFATATIRLVKSVSDRIELEIDGDGPTLLVAVNGYSPFWQSTADGRPLEMFPAYHAFWGVILPPGTRSVVFEYRPPGLAG